MIKLTVAIFGCLMGEIITLCMVHVGCSYKISFLIERHHHVRANSVEQPEKYISVV